MLIKQAERNLYYLTVLQVRSNDREKCSTRLLARIMPCARELHLPSLILLLQPLLKFDFCDVIFQVFNGNHDTDSIVYNTLNYPITTRYVRVRPVSWQVCISMRMELYGCPGI